MTQQVAAIVGAQFGSEGKGLIAEKLAADFDVHIRTGAPNAGHTYYITERVDSTSFGTGASSSIPGLANRVKVVARSVPVGAANTNALLVIGPGALIDIELLLEEARELDQHGMEASKRLRVDGRAMVIDKQRHHQFEGGVHGDAHKLIGSTGEGVGPARMARILRGAMSSPRPIWSVIDQVETHRDVLEEAGIQVCDTAQLVNDLIDQGARVMLEGTQGSGLSLIHGPWPFVTSGDTNAAQLAADAGIAPSLISNVILVARVNPIRVAGRSGPLPKETSWENLDRPEERTTVTRKVRRVAMWSDDLVRRAIMLNRPTEMAITFADYLDKGAYGCTEWAALSDSVRWDIKDFEAATGVPVSMIGTGPDSVIFRGMSYGFRGRKGPWPSHEDAYGSVDEYVRAEALRSV